jgi:hypothetical protein
MSWLRAFESEFSAVDRHHLAAALRWAERSMTDRLAVTEELRAAAAAAAHWIGERQIGPAILRYCPPGLQ